MRTIRPGKVGYVVTTINHPTQAMFQLSELLSERFASSTSNSISHDSEIFVVGDKKTPSNWNLPLTNYLSVDAQATSGSKLALSTPWNSYARKMLGYLEAIKSECEWIKETDDDNVPRHVFLEIPKRQVSARTADSNNSGWINLYSAFTSRRIWPRGLPLQVLNDLFLNPAVYTEDLTSISNVVLYQALADGEPDVDALYRLTVEEESKIKFDIEHPVLFPKNAYSPFNSQATSWHNSIFPLMYLPITCSFRMTDIWRSFIVQRILRDTELNLVFVGAEVFQDRNPHNLLKDFEDEIEGYLGNEKLRQILEDTELLGGPMNYRADLMSVYKNLIDGGLLKNSELESLGNWLDDVHAAGWRA